MNSIRDLIIFSGNVIERLIFLAGAIALLVFLWGLAKFMFKAGDAKATEEGKNLMIWGVVALFVMTSVWGILFFIQNTLGIHPFLDPELRFNPTGINP